MKALRPLAALALLLLCALHALALLRAPTAWMPAQVTVALAPGAKLDLDGAMLGAPDAGPSLRLRRDPDGGWWLARTGGGALAFERDGNRHRSGSAALRAGQRFQLGASTFNVDAADGRTASFSSRGTGWRYDGATLLRDGAPQPACPDARIGARLAAGWNRFAPSFVTMARPLVFGGNLDCGNRIAIPGLPAPAARIARFDAALLLSAGASQFPLLLTDAGRTAALAGREERLDAGSAVIAGRTRLPLQLNGDLLHLRPAGNVALYADAQVALPPGVTWTWTRRALWTLPAQAAVPLSLAATLASIAAGIVCWIGRRRRTRRELAASVAGALLAACGLALFWLQRGGTPAGAGIAMLLAWAALWLAWWAPRRLPLALAAGILLLAAGLLAQLELGLGAPASIWLRHFQKTSWLLAAGVGLGTLLRPLRPAVPWPQARIEAVLMLLAGAALAALLLQVAFGDETGVFDLQPVEFAKLALSALTAHCLALATGGQPAPGGMLVRTLRLVAPALLFAGVLGVALVQVDDYSPLVLLAVWSGAMALVHALATRQRVASGLLLAGAALAVFGIALLRGAGPEGLSQWNFYADRFLVWLDPGSHPHTGQQLLLGARAVAEGGWFGADSAFGLASLGRGAGPALHIPAVQDDFAPSFFLNRHGLAAALVLWLLQAAFLAGLVKLALHCWQAQAGTRDFRRAWLARFRCFLLCGGAAFVFAHFLLSWGTNLAIFPVMGQPMSFLSAGGSHLLFFICPLLAFGAASAQSFEENEPCRASYRTTSNAKS